MVSKRDINNRVKPGSYTTGLIQKPVDANRRVIDELYLNSLDKPQDAAWGAPVLVSLLRTRASDDSPKWSLPEFRTYRAAGDDPVVVTNYFNTIEDGNAVNESLIYMSAPFMPRPHKEEWTFGDFPNTFLRSLCIVRDPGDRGALYIQPHTAPGEHSELPWGDKLTTDCMIQFDKVEAEGGISIQALESSKVQVSGTLSFYKVWVVEVPEGTSLQDLKLALNEHSVFSSYYQVYHAEETEGGAIMPGDEGSSRTYGFAQSSRMLFFPLPTIDALCAKLTVLFNRKDITQLYVVLPPDPIDEDSTFSRVLKPETALTVTPDMLKLSTELETSLLGAEGGYGPARGSNLIPLAYSITPLPGPGIDPEAPRAVAFCDGTIIRASEFLNGEFIPEGAGSVRTIRLTGCGLQGVGGGSIRFISDNAEVDFVLWNEENKGWYKVTYEGNAYHIWRVDKYRFQFNRYMIEGGSDEVIEKPLLKMARSRGYVGIGYGEEEDYAEFLKRRIRGGSPIDGTDSMAWDDNTLALFLDDEADAHSGIMIGTDTGDGLRLFTRNSGTSKPSFLVTSDTLVLGANVDPSTDAGDILTAPGGSIWLGGEVASLGLGGSKLTIDTDSSALLHEGTSVTRGLILSDEGSVLQESANVKLTLDSDAKLEQGSHRFLHMTNSGVTLQNDDNAKLSLTGEAILESNDDNKITLGSTAVNIIGGGDGAEVRLLAASAQLRMSNDKLVNIAGSIGDTFLRHGSAMLTLNDTTAKLEQGSHRFLEMTSSKTTLQDRSDVKLELNEDVLLQRTDVKKLTMSNITVLQNTNDVKLTLSSTAKLERSEHQFLELGSTNTVLHQNDDVNITLNANNVELNPKALTGETKCNGPLRLGDTQLLKGHSDGTSQPRRLGLWPTNIFLQHGGSTLMVRGTDAVGAIVLRAVASDTGPVPETDYAKPSGKLEVDPEGVTIISKIIASNDSNFKVKLTNPEQSAYQFEGSLQLETLVTGIEVSKNEDGVVTDISASTSLAWVFKTDPSP